MKTIGKLCMLVFVMTSLIGCSTDDDNTNSTSSSLIGTWSMIEFDYEGSTSFSAQGQSSSSSFVGTGQNFDYNITFTENPNEYTASGSYDVVLDFTSNGTQQTETTSINDVQTEGTWERNGDILAIDGDFVEVNSDIPTVGGTTMGEVTILELTETTLRLGQEVVQDTSENGISVSIDLTAEIVFVRQ